MVPVSTPFDEFEARGWAHGKAGPYSSFFTRVSDLFAADLLDAAGVRAGDRVLDVGCGPGNISAIAASRGASVVGVDLSEEMLSVAAELHPGIEFRRGDAEELPFDFGTFDAVVGNLVILHVGDSERAAAEFARVLRPGGRLALTTWDTPERSRFTGLFLEAISEVGAEPPPEMPAGPARFNFAVEDPFTDLLEAAGFDDVSVAHVAQPATFSSAGELWDGFLSSSVRIVAVISAQPESTQAAIRAAFDRLAAQSMKDGRLAAAPGVILGSGRKALIQPAPGSAPG